MHDTQAFRTSLIGLTDVTRGYFEKLVGQLEKGFDHLEQDYGGGNAEEAALIEVGQYCLSTNELGLENIRGWV